jgi:hypothetical protein
MLLVVMVAQLLLEHIQLVVVQAVNIIVVHILEEEVLAEQA